VRKCRPPFEKRLIGIEIALTGLSLRNFADGTTAEGDFVIGADGAHSVLRTHVVPDGPRPFDTGLIGFGGLCRAQYSRIPRLGSASRPPLAKAGSSATAFAAPIPRTA